MSFLYRVRVRGDLACFTRPEFKTERFSYEVMTPSAARGILEAILWKPAIQWQIRRILLLAPPRFIQLGFGCQRKESGAERIAAGLLCG
jgi:CRISPR-associated protein Cas5d